MTHAFEASEIGDSLAHGCGQALLERTLECGKLLFSELEPGGFAYQPFVQLFGQGRAVVTGQFTACESPGERPVIDFVPASHRNKQLAHALTMLDHLLVQLSAVSNQMARGFVLHGGRAHDAHPVTLTMQPGTQVGDQLDGIQPVRLRTS
nr:hypothetical protein [Burkholderia ubonensis]